MIVADINSNLKSILHLKISKEEKMKKALVPVITLVLCFGLLAGSIHLVNDGAIEKVKLFVNDTSLNVAKSAQKCGKNASLLAYKSDSLTSNIKKGIAGSTYREIDKIGEKHCKEIQGRIENYVDSFSFENIDALVYNALKDSIDSASNEAVVGFLDYEQKCDESFSHLYRTASSITGREVAQLQQCLEKPKKFANRNKKRMPVEDIVRKMHVVATAYTNDIRCIGAKWFDGKTASMTKVRWGVVAVDPRVIPLGSKIYIENMGWFSAEDTGGKVKGNKIDIFYPTRKQAINFGKKRLKVFILHKNTLKKYDYNIRI